MEARRTPRHACVPRMARLGHQLQLGLRARSSRAAKRIGKTHWGGT
jgi:hypothetical protein